MAKLIVSLLLACTLTALAVVHSQYRVRQLNAELENLNQARDELYAEWTQLLLEESAYASEARVVSVAEERLGMHFLTPDEIVQVRP